MIVTEDLGTVQREAWAARVLPPVEEVRPGLWSIPVPMPKNPLRYVLSYALALDDGLALIDLGMDTEESWDTLVADAAALGHFTPEDVAADKEAWRVDLTELGAPPEVVEAARFELVRFPEGESADVVLAHGDRLDLPGWNIEAVWTPGHTPGHLAFVDRDRDLLFSGDHMLPRISPNISSGPGELGDPLHRYLLSLHATTALPDCEVLPAHEYRFRGVTERARQLMDHHEVRLDEIREAVAARPESTAWEITTRVTWSRPIDVMNPRLQRLAVRETQAHLIVLADRGDIRSDGGTPARWTLSAPTDTKEN
ncbi:beta-lactamase [Rhodococcus pyridinivorans KG-16]|uniref:Beta-lactamase n=1 Tax=Rhodococcus pyridinivorans KG-16 TaxID=1441730 RepID=A0A0V9UIQ4_9NOCA|nr:MBL fold metallo-hydrolase [Rhodococcus pyridinivorans]KSZ57891.1 beta-lactamase [Rhodococcus pyridinivorans KG-16]